MHNSLNTRKIALPEPWVGVWRNEWHSEHQGWFFWRKKEFHTEDLGPSKKFLRFLDLGSFRRAWPANQPHTIYVWCFWNSFLRVDSFIQLLYSLCKAFFHYLLCIPIYFCGVFLSISPLSAWFNFFICSGCLLPHAVC